RVERRVSRRVRAFRRRPARAFTRVLGPPRDRYCRRPATRPSRRVSPARRCCLAAPRGRRDTRRSAMSDPHGADSFDHPLIRRYASREMAALFAPSSRHRAWRELWIALARAQRDLGLEVSEAQIAELVAVQDTFDWERLAELERELRHDVMAHIHHFGELAPAARGILHLGATS